jgi:hypothetical protein
MRSQRILDYPRLYGITASSTANVAFLYPG